MSMKKTIAIMASSRRNGNTGKLIDWIADDLGIEVVDLGVKNITPYDYEHKNIDDDFLPLMKHILQHDNIIFASPVYWYAMSAQMKVFIDRLSDLLDMEDLREEGRQLRSKVAYVITTSVSEQVSEAFIDSFTNTFSYLGMGYGGFVHANCESGFDPDAYQYDVNEFVNRLQAV